ncbi:ATP-binding protein [Humibacillus sp. DSM 29435]|uniref:ATP-binding protein n=1 Tax=Humibacillus sp. DSM 29435 TaxID=1869167 RepID=UPI0009F5C058|nr:ATP-binding protein [Humibacillus sp. DSM 29435]
MRQREGRVVGGVSIGLAEHLRVPVRLVRLVFILTAVPFGAGFAVYIFLWATMRQAPRDRSVIAETGAPGGIQSGAGAPTLATRPDLSGVKAWLRSGNEAVILTVLGVTALVVSAALWLSTAGFDLHPEVVLPVVAIFIGAIFFWSQLDDTDALGSRRPVRWVWLVVGLVLTTLGLVGLLVRGTSIGDLWQVAGAVVAALIGVAVLAAPWILRLWSRLREEQAARIRATERADIAAHLHDSVLQTLALIQRQSGDAVTVARLARAQERQLRSYLYDQDAHADSLGTAITAAMNEIEDLQGVAVQVVVTGDRAMDPHLDALVKAVREATWNAVRHASPPITVYVEVGPKAVEAFVRDHGGGFELAEVPDDRAGVRESIIGRMERHGGSASIRRRPDGTEIELRLPVEAANGAFPAGSAPSGPAPSPTAHPPASEQHGSRHAPHAASPASPPNHHEEPSS